jgi:hypothetical protein
MANEEDTHDHLMRLFRQYFKENQVWETKQTHTAGIKTRHLLAEIRIVARKRRAEIIAIRKAKPSQSTPKMVESNRRIAEMKKAKQVDVVAPPNSTDNGTS